MSALCMYVSMYVCCVYVLMNSCALVSMYLCLHVYECLYFGMQAYILVYI
jgi:hypothetical protein